QDQHGRRRHVHGDPPLVSRFLDRRCSRGHCSLYRKRRASQRNRTKWLILFEIKKHSRALWKKYYQFDW
ncbi:MAG: hypothetical protein ABL908_21575, partial [Hyphomicrobium sp.]